MAHEELLARTDFFADAPASVIREIAAAGAELPLIRGDVLFRENVGSSRVDLQACKLEYSIVSPK